MYFYLGSLQPVPSPTRAPTTDFSGIVKSVTPEGGSASPGYTLMIISTVSAVFAAAVIIVGIWRLYLNKKRAESASSIDTPNSMPIINEDFIDWPRGFVSQLIGSILKTEVNEFLTPAAAESIDVVEWPNELVPNRFSLSKTLGSDWGHFNRDFTQTANLNCTIENSYRAKPTETAFSTPSSTVPQAIEESITDFMESDTIGYSTSPGHVTPVRMKSGDEEYSSDYLTLIEAREQILLRSTRVISRENSSGTESVNPMFGWYLSSSSSSESGSPVASPRRSSS